MKKKKQGYKENQIDREEQTILINTMLMVLLIQKNKEKWKKSKSYVKTKVKLSNLQRKIAEKREQSHNILANSILEIGTIVKVENMSFKALQRRSKKTEISEKTGKFKKKKRFGKSLSNRAPALLIETINRKLEYIGKI